MFRRSVTGPAEAHALWHLARFKQYKEKLRRRRFVEPDSLPGYVRFGYSMGHVLNDLCASLWFTYSLVFYTAVIGLSHKMAGIIMIIGQIADAIATPVIGTLSDRGSSKIQSKKCGKRKFFYIAGTAIIVVTKPFMFSPCFFCRESAEIWKVCYFSVFVVLFQLGWAAVQTIHLAMAADLTPYENERTFLLSLRNTMTAVCNSATYMGQLMTTMSGGNVNRPLDHSDVVHFQIVVVSITVVGIITSIIFLILVPEDASKFRLASLESQSTSTFSQASTKIHHPLRMLMSKWRLHYVGLIYMNTRIFVVSVQALLTLYLNESLKSYVYELATVPLVLNMSSFLSSLATQPFTECFGRKTVFMTGTIFGCGACLWTYLGSGETYNHKLIYIVAVFYGIACALLLVTSLALVADYIGEDINDGATIYGYMSFLDKVSTGIALYLIMEFRSDNREYFMFAVVLSCAISGVVGSLLLLLLALPVQPIGETLTDTPNEDAKKKQFEKINIDYKEKISKENLRSGKQ